MEDGTAAEKAVLALGMMETSMMDAIHSSGIRPEHFSSSNGKRCLQAITGLRERGEAVDTITVTTEMNRLAPDGMNSLAFVVRLDEMLPNPNGLDTYVSAVKAASMRVSARRASALLKNIPKDLITSEEILGYVVGITKKMQEKDEQGTVRGMVTANDSIREVLDALDTDEDSQPTGLRGIDDILVGMMDQGLYVIAGRPGMGKTSLALAITKNFLHRSRRVAFFSLEMSHKELSMRILSAETGIQSGQIRRRQFTQKNWEDMIAAGKTIGSYSLVIEDSAQLDINTLIARCKMLGMQEGGLDLIVVDYLQLMSSSRYSGNRVQEISEITRGLKAIAKMMDCPVIALSQLNRAVEMRVDKRPVLNDLRESGSIEQDADAVLFLFRQSYYKGGPVTGVDVAEIIIAKHRAGATGTGQLVWVPEISTFKDTPNWYGEREEKDETGEAIHESANTEGDEGSSAAERLLATDRPPGLRVVPTSVLG